MLLTKQFMDHFHTYEENNNMEVNGVHQPTFFKISSFKFNRRKKLIWGL